MLNTKGTITIRIEDTSFQETERLRIMLHSLIQSGALNMRNGKVVLNFDEEGLAQISYDYIRWKRNKPIVLTDLYKNAVLEVIAGQ